MINPQICEDRRDSELKFVTSVVDIIQRTSDIISVRFERPEGFNYLPGQFMFITIQKNGAKLTKHFTISSSPTEETLEVTKKLTGHDFSNALNNLKIGEIVTVDAPYGDFTFSGEHCRALFLTGGIGITPIRSILRYCVDERLSSDMVLLYSCRFEDDILFKEEIDELKEESLNLNVFYTVSKPSKKWGGYTGRITGKLIRECVPDYTTRFTYISGPPAMVESMEMILTSELNVHASEIITEKFKGL